jgi:hypothetical protein
VTVIPIGRHSVMHGVWMDNTVQRNEKEVARFCTRMIGLFDKIGRACMWQKHIISENIEKAGFAHGLDIEVEDYLQKVSLLPMIAWRIWNVWRTSSVPQRQPLNSPAVAE